MRISPYLAALLLVAGACSDVPITTASAPAGPMRSLTAERIVYVEARTYHLYADGSRTFERFESGGHVKGVYWAPSAPSTWYPMGDVDALWPNNSEYWTEPQGYVGRLDAFSSCRFRRWVIYTTGSTIIKTGATVLLSDYPSAHSFFADFDC